MSEPTKPHPKHVYAYVGDHNDLTSDEDEIARTRQPISSTADIAAWIERHGDEVEFDGSVPAIYVINPDFQLRIASRYSEHVVCAQAGKVLAAGEIFFGDDHGTPTVERITNQSTGYCPRPSSWPIVDHVLNEIGISRPEVFDPGFVFRWCKPCGNIEIVKDDDFTCLMCGAELPEEWNIDQWEPLAEEEGADDNGN